MQPLFINTLGNFSIQYGDTIISDNNIRSKKVWLLIIHLICLKGHPVSRQRLINVLWGDDPSINNPENALKITLHRARIQLDSLYPNAGHQLILHDSNGYLWNPEVPLISDCEKFERLCKSAEEDEQKRCEEIKEAISLYKGDFLSKFSSETWIIPLSTYFHSLYVETVLSLCPMLFNQDRNNEAAEICRTAINIDPYHEPLYQKLIQALINMGELKAATAAYNELSEKLFNDFGIKPNDETTSMYRTALNSLNDLTMPIDMVMEQVHEADAPDGALECDYEFFKILCFAESRAMLRNGKASHISLFSIVSNNGTPLPKRSQERIMEQLGTHIRTNLRRGDAYAKLSTTQYSILLLEANYEDSLMVSKRLIASFHRKFPHSPIKINHMVQPLSPYGFN